MTTVNGSMCPAAPFPGLIDGSPGHQFALALTIIYPIYLIVVLSLFRYFQKTSVYLRKRGFWIMVVSGILSMGCWSATCLYDYIGSTNYPCDLVVFFTYVANPIVSFPLTIKAVSYRSQVAHAKLIRELQNEHLKSNDGGEDGSVKMLQGEWSMRTMLGHFRAVFCCSKRREDRILNAKFSRSTGFLLLWFLMTAAPYLFGYIVRICITGFQPGCTGCEILPGDAVCLIIITAIVMILSIFGNPSFSRRVSKQDALRIVRECMWSWQLGGMIYEIGLILFIIDPNQTYASGIFNFRVFLTLAMMVLFYIQTIYQIQVSRWIRHAIIFAPSLDQRERFHEVLSDKDLKHQLERFMDSELSSEVLRYMNAVERFKAANHDADAILNPALKIVNEFIVRGAPLEVNISAKTRNELIAKAVKRELDLTSFDQAYAEVQTSFLEDGFSRFLKKLERDQRRKQQMAVVSFTIVSTEQESTYTSNNYA